MCVFLLRLSTCSLIEGRWFQSVPRHSLHPCQSGLQRSSHQKCVRAYCHCQRQGMTCIWTRWRAAFSDNKGLWRSSECEQRESAASRSPSPDLKWSNLHCRRKDVVYQRWRRALALSKWIASGWIMNPWYTVGVSGLVSAECSGNRTQRFMKYTDIRLVTTLILVMLTLMCRGLSH